MLLASMLLCGSQAYAQVDPTVMTINGQPVSRSEFEYSYNKNNSEGVIDKKNVDEYVDLFINYKLKVIAALEARLDTLKSFNDEFATYRDQQIRPAVITDADVEKEARKIYRETQTRVDSTGGLIRPAHILILLNQKATKEQQAAAAQRIDSIYNALRNGADFASLAKKCSDDKRSAAEGGQLPWIQRGQTLKEFEDVAFGMKVGQMSKPFMSPAGWHIVRLDGKQNFFPYDSVRTDIVKFIEQRGLRDRIIDSKLDSLAKADGPQTTSAQILEKKKMEMESKDPDLKNLIREYHDGLLLYEICNLTVWDKAAKDEAGLEKYFRKNKKKYAWEQPRFKGIAYHVKNQDDVKAVKNAVRNLPFDKWADVLRKTFNNDSILRIRVEKGYFKAGDNPLVDKEVFRKDTTVTPMSQYPIGAVFGKKLKAPKELEDVRSQVVADYQEYLEKEWVATLRRKYPVVVNKEVVATVNKH